MDAAQARRRLETGIEKLTETRRRLDRIRRYREGNHDKPFMPPGVSQEYIKLRELSQANILPLIANAPLQRLRVGGYSSHYSNQQEDNQFWRETWQHNRMDQRQRIVHEDAYWYGRGITSVSPGSDQKRPRIAVESPFRVHIEMDPADVFKPLYAVKYITDSSEASTNAGAVSGIHLPNGSMYNPGKAVERAWVYDSDESWEFVRVENSSSTWELAEDQPVSHSLGAVPFVPYDVQLDSEGNPHSLIEQLIPAQDSINFVRFSTLLALQFSAYRQRAITGYDPVLRDESGEILYQTDENGEIVRDPQTGLGTPLLESLGRVGVDRLLAISNADAKVWDMPESNLQNYIELHNMLIQDVFARGQVPPQYQLTNMHNLTGDALTGAESTLSSLVASLQSSLAESHEQTLRLCMRARGESTDDISSEVLWDDGETRSYGQTVDAIVKLIGTGFPREEAYKMLPGMTQQKLSAVMRLREREAKQTFEMIEAA